MSLNYLEFTDDLAVVEIYKLKTCIDESYVNLNCACELQNKCPQCICRMDIYSVNLSLKLRSLISIACGAQVKTIEDITSKSQDSSCNHKIHREPMECSNYS